MSLPEGEKPTELVLDDDTRFDEWLKQYTVRQMAEQRKSSNHSGGNAAKHDQVINF